MDRQRLKEKILHGTPAFPLAVYQYRFHQNNSVRFHYHKEFELLLAVDSCVQVRIEEKVYCLNAGDGVFVNSDLLHMISSGDGNDYTYIAVVFDSSLLCGQQEVVYVKYISTLMRQKSSIQPLLSMQAGERIHEIADICKKGEFAYELQVKQMLFEIMYQLMCKVSFDLPNIANPKSQLLKMVFDYIEHNYMHPITLQDLAAVAHVSREYLCRIFREWVDNTPVGYLNRYRVERSAEFLTKTDRSVSEIAMSCGFSNCNYFDKLFRRLIGCTPGQYRKQQFH